MVKQSWRSSKREELGSVAWVATVDTLVAMDIGGAGDEEEGQPMKEGDDMKFGEIRGIGQSDCAKTAFLDLARAAKHFGLSQGLE